MLKNKILLKITGSIAAYKSAYLVSKLVKNGYEVKVVMSKSAEKFIGVSTFEALTGNAVYTDMFARKESLSHINLMKWADLIIVAPATANTINSFANGDGSSLITTLFLAHNFDKPYLIAPAMNTKMYIHPATERSISVLKEWGIVILETDSGRLACGDEGVGKLLNPDEIFIEIKKRLNPKGKNLSVLVTSGGTKEDIDGVRFITNMSTGNTGATIADSLITAGFDVTFLFAENSAVPKRDCKIKTYVSFNDLNSELKNLLWENNFDAVIHLAAVSDYSVSNLKLNGETLNVPLTKKMDSSSDKIELHLEKNFKIIDRIKSYSQNKKIALVGFKLAKGSSRLEKENSVKSLLSSAGADFVVLNDLDDRLNSVQTNFRIFSNKGELATVSSSKEISKIICDLLIEKKGEK